MKTLQKSEKKPQKKFHKTFKAKNAKFINKKNKKPSKEDKDLIREKTLKSVLLNNEKKTLKNKSKKDHYREFKRLMKLYTTRTKSIQTLNLISTRQLREKIIHLLSKKLDSSYKYAFMYIKMLSSTLYTSYKDTKKTSIYPVYNWSFISNLELWTEFICQYALKNKNIESLVSPLIMIITGVLKLRQSTRFIPLRLHCVAMLNKLSNSLKVTTSVFSILIEMLNSVNFNKKNKKDQKNPLNLMTMLHFSNHQSETFEYLETTLYQIYQMIIEYTQVFAYTSIFPSIIVHLVKELSNFAKKCTVTMFSSDIKVLVKHLKKHGEFIQIEMLNKPGLYEINKKHEAFDKFLEKYRASRLLELKKIMDSTMHINYAVPEDDYKESQKTTDDLNNEESDDDDENNDLNNMTVEYGYMNKKNKKNEVVEENDDEYKLNSDLDESMEFEDDGEDDDEDVE